MLFEISDDYLWLIEISSSLCPKWLIIDGLWASSSGRSDGGAGKGRRDCNYVSGIWIPPPIPCGYPSTKLSDFSANVNKHWKARAKGNDVIAKVISANQDFASTFSTQIFKFQRCSCKLSFIFPPRRQIAPESFLAGDIIGSLLLNVLGTSAGHLSRDIDIEYK